MHFGSVLSKDIKKNYFVLRLADVSRSNDWPWWVRDFYQSHKLHNPTQRSLDLMAKVTYVESEGIAGLRTRLNTIVTQCTLVSLQSPRIQIANIMRCVQGCPFLADILKDKDIRRITERPNHTSEDIPLLWSLLILSEEIHKQSKPLAKLLPLSVTEEEEADVLAMSSSEMDQVIKAISATGQKNTMMVQEQLTKLSQTTGGLQDSVTQLAGAIRLLSSGPPSQAPSATVPLSPRGTQLTTYPVVGRQAEHRNFTRPASRSNTPYTPPTRGRDDSPPSSNPSGLSQQSALPLERRPPNPVRTSRYPQRRPGVNCIDGCIVNSPLGDINLCSDAVLGLNEQQEQDVFLKVDQVGQAETATLADIAKIPIDVRILPQVSCHQSYLIDAMYGRRSELGDYVDSLLCLAPPSDT